MKYIPLRNITINELESTHWFIIQKICDVLFTDNYNSYAIRISRNILEFILKADLVTYKQAKLIIDLKPNKTH